MADEDTQWKGYSAYEEISSQLHEDVNRAIKAYSHVNSKDSQGVGITPRTAVNAKSAILGISKRIFFEVERNATAAEEYSEVYERWSGNEVDGGDVIEREEPGYIRRLENADLTREVPPWLGQMTDDLIRVSWKLGYIRSGTEKPSDPDDDETQVEEMFE